MGKIVSNNKKLKQPKFLPKTAQKTKRNDLN